MAKSVKVSSKIQLNRIGKGTSQGRKPIFSTMNKSKRRSFKKYRGQGRV